MVVWLFVWNADLPMLLPCCALYVGVGVGAPLLVVGLCMGFWPLEIVPMWGVLASDIVG